jgi:hypothetical protein
MADGVKQPSEEGATGLSAQPAALQRLPRRPRPDAGGARTPLRPLLDDVTIYVRSKRGGRARDAGTGEFIERRLRLRVNRGKSSVASASGATLLGFGLLSRDGEVKVRIDPKARHRQRPTAPPHLALPGRLAWALWPS